MRIVRSDHLRVHKYYFTTSISEKKYVEGFLPVFFQQALTLLAYGRQTRCPMAWIHSTCLQTVSQGWMAYLNIVYLDVLPKRSEFLPLLDGSMDKTDAKHQLPPRHSKSSVGDRERGGGDRGGRRVLKQ